MDPSQRTQSTGTNVNSLPASAKTPSTEDRSSVAGKNQQGQQVRQNEGRSHIPAPDQITHKSLYSTPQSFESVTGVKPQKNWLTQWLSSLFSDSKVEATKPAPKLPTNPGSFSGHTTDLEKRSTQRVETGSSSWFDSLPSLPEWLTGKKVEPAKSSKGLIPLAEREEAYKTSTFTKAVNLVASAVRLVDTATMGAISDMTGKAKNLTEEAVTYFTGKSFAGHAKQFLASKGTRFPSINDEAFQAMLGNIARVLAANPDDINSEFQTLEIPTIEIDVGLITPLRIKGLKLRARLAPYPKDCTLIQKQKFQRAVEIEDLACTVDLPRADQAPATLEISLPKGVLSIGSNITATTGITDIGRLLTSGQSGSLPFDHTAIQIKADALKVGFKKLNVATPFDPGAPPSLEAPGVLGFNEGAVEMKDVCIATPLSLLRKAPDQTTIVQCGGFKLSNSISRDVMVNLRSIDVASLDPQLSGPLKLDIGLDLRKLRHFGGIMSQIPKFLLNARMDCHAAVQLHKGELDFKQLKKGLKFTSTGTNWWSKKLTGWLNAIVSSDSTCLVAGKDGKPAVRFHVPIPLKNTLRKIPVIGRYMPSALPIPVEFPLPINGLCPSADNQGKVVVVDLISTVVQNLLMSWFQIPGKAQIVQKDHEQLCTAAASGNISVSKALTTIAGELESSGHPGQALRMWQAIPSAHIAQLSREDTQLPPELINKMAHRLVEVDPDKAISLYGLALKDTPLGELPENYDGEAVLNAALRLDQNKPNEMAVALDIFEFLATAHPQGRAFAILNQLFRNGQYPKERMSALMVRVIHLPPYADNLSLQANLLEEMEPMMGDTIKEALASLPTHQLRDHHGITARDTAAHFEHLMLKYHLDVQAARMYQNIQDPARANKILEQCIQRNDEGSPAALEERITGELRHGSYGTSRYVSGYQLLMDLEKKPLSPNLQQTREHMLKALWHETRGLQIQWPGLSVDKTTPRSVTRFVHAASRLFSISRQELDSPDQLFEILTDIYKEMTEAENSADNPEQTFGQLLQFKSLVNSLMADTRMYIEALRYMEAQQYAQRTRGQRKSKP